MPDTRPDMRFEGGVCSACLSYDQRKKIDWSERKRVLERILERTHGNEYDCIVPSSGGKDSHFQVLTLLEMGVRVLIVTATTCDLTPVGRRNIDNLARFADTIEITPNRKVRAKLNKLALEIVGDISWPEHVLIHTVPFKVALEKQIPLVFYGENPLALYGGPNEKRQNEEQMTRRWVSEFGGFLGMRPEDFIGLDDITDRDMQIYRGPTDRDLEQAGIEVYFLGQFVPWDSHHNAKVAIEHGFESILPCTANWWFSENEDNSHTGLHDFLMWKKYGYGRACAQLSVDIRSGRISMPGAVKELEMCEGLFPYEYAGVRAEDALGRIGMTLDRFRQIAERFSCSRTG